ncbi:MAG: hypothetical protein F4Z28_07005 [Gammaproteobacteria bacterium]|nr:hypothetical protein [Gammaproteobacteria bacterium]
MRNAPPAKVIVDLDCRHLAIPKGRKRSDYVVVTEEDGAGWVSPIELKSGAFRGREVAEQLQGGADTADEWLPDACSFNFVPILAHGRSVPKPQLRTLRAAKVRLRDRVSQAVLIRCGEPLRKALDHVSG